MSSRDANIDNRAGWEQTEFPVLCETCLGENPYVRMTKRDYGAACKICDRPFTVFRWCPGRKMRFKKTEICQTCSKLKNVCQTCLFDLEFGLPVQVRDKYLKMDEKMPTSNVNKEYYIQNQERRLNNTDGTQPLPELTQPQSSGRAILEKMARRTPYYKRNAPHICSFWVKGECKRGDLCPYRHEMPYDPDDPLSKQNMKDRYYGSDDPVAEKMMKRAKTSREVEAPEDKTITTLYIGGLREQYGITEQDIRDVFYEHGEIQRVTMPPNKKMAFVEYTTREAAQRAMEALQGTLNIKGHYLRLLWARPKAAQRESGPADPTAAPPVPKVPGLPGAVPIPASVQDATQEQDTSSAADASASATQAASTTAATTAAAPAAAAAASSSSMAASSSSAPAPSAPAGAPPVPAVLRPPRPGPPMMANPILGSILRPPPPMAPRAPMRGGPPRMGALYPSMDPSRMGSRSTANQVHAKGAKK